MTQTNILCNGDCNGTATATPLGGPVPIFYTWSNNATTATIVNLCPGTYTVTVIDAVPDTVIDSVLITEPSPLLLTTTSVDENCGQCDGSFNIVPSGGTMPYTYIFSPPVTGLPATALCAGLYCVTVTDFNLCTEDTCILINAVGPLNFTTSVVNAPCDSSCVGTATVNITCGYLPYTFQWNDLNNQTTQTATGLCAGTYIVTVTDNLAQTDTANVTVIVNPTYNINDAPITICDGDSALMYGNYETSAGIYYDSLATINGCDSIFSTVLAVDPVYSETDSISINQGDSILIGGGYQTVAGIYYDTLVAANGCDSIVATTLTVVVGIQQPLIDNHQFTIYPNPTKGKFTVENVSGEIQVYDLFGRLVLRTNNAQVDISGYPAGIYMVRAGEAVSKLVLQ